MYLFNVQSTMFFLVLFKAFLQQFVRQIAGNLRLLHSCWYSILSGQLIYKQNLTPTVMFLQTNPDIKSYHNNIAKKLPCHNEQTEFNK